MAPRLEVREVKDLDDKWQVVYDMTLDDGTVTEHGHCFPKDTLEWRAAEYDLDPVADLESLLDIVLAEPYIALEEQPGTMAEEELHDAPDVVTARQRHVSRCARAKLKHRLSTRKAPAAQRGKALGAAPAPVPHPLDVIRQQSPLDDEVIEIKRAHVREIRARVKRHKERGETREERARRIAEQLEVKRPRPPKEKNT